MKKTLYLTGLVTMSTVLIASAQSSLYTTTNDFAQFNGGVVTNSSIYYSISSTVNGIGNSSDPGGTGGVGSLQLNASGGWTGWLAGSDFPGQTAASFSALSPGATRPWSAESGYGAGTMVANSGIMTFDIYGGNFTDWNWWGITLNYDGHFDTFFASTSSNFTGADGNTWTHYEIPYTTYAASMSYFGIGIAQNASGAIAGQTFYIDNFQVQAVPEPGTIALAAMGGAALLFLRRRAAR
jgi:hypothetical protein